ncbi:hypothetical protein BCR44DRAFT_1443661 [Catenaria anguillulae PL171]|uniref:E3 ubiquitin-protein ligase n=1 Tax=Catenaria anguillulae PL171 TaxID=765915 RepID=A0A1Y2HAE8_9FUNG|nr:hypothetical protein BCR44DRAFT_1443661 [Catenaria anguillulae PL171]
MDTHHPPTLGNDLPGHHHTDDGNNHDLGLRAAIAAALDHVIDAFLLHFDSTQANPAPTHQHVLLTAAALDPEAASASAQNPIWSVCLWNDEIHSFSQVISLVAKAARCSRQDAERSAVVVDQERLGVTVDLKRNALRHMSAAAVISWIHDMVVNADHASAPQVRAAVLQALFEPHCPANAAALAQRKIPALYPPQALPSIFPQLASSSSPSPPALNSFIAHARDAASDPIQLDTVFAQFLYSVDQIVRQACPHSAFALRDIDPSERSTRLFRLFLIDHKLWKQPRALLSEFLVATVIVDPAAKIRFARMFSAAYPILFGIYVSLEREKEVSILNLAVQLFTSNSVARDLVEGGLFLSLLSLFATQLGASSLSSHPIGFVDKWELDTTTPFAVQEHLSRDTARLVPFIEFLVLLHGQHKKHRQTGTHVEYEDETWIELQHIIIHLISTLQHIAKPHSGNTRALDLVANTLVEAELSFDVKRLPCGAMVPDGSILSTRGVSLYNPLHLLLRALHPTPQWMVSRAGTGETEVPLLHLLDEPLSSVALVSHVQAGLWVRNGAVIRSLVHYYAMDPRFRSELYDADIALVQLAAQCAPSSAVPWILDRFGLYPDRVDPGMAEDVAKTMAVMEDLLLLFVTLATDDPNLDMHERARRGIIHSLIVKPKTYSELTADLPAPILDAVDTQLDAILDLLATTMVASEGSFLDSYGSGAKFTLKPEFLAEVHPMFKYLNRNARLEVAKLLKEKNLVKIPDPVSPSMLEFLFHPTLATWLVRVIAFAQERNHWPLVEASLMLLAIMAKDSGVSCPPRAATTASGHSSVSTTVQSSAMSIPGTWELRSDSPLTLPPAAAVAPRPDSPAAASSSHSAWEWFLLAHPDLLDAVISLPSSSGLHEHIMAQIRNRIPSALPAPPRQESDASASAAASAQSADSKRQAAAERQRRILEAMQKQQAQFAANFADELDDDDMDDEDELVEDPGNPSQLTCLVCQLPVDESQPAGYAARVELSSMVRLEKAAAASPSSSQPGDSVSLPGLYLHACGHVLHKHCLDAYLQTIMTRQATQRSRNHPELALFEEYLCPLCKTLCNTLVLIHQPTHKAQALASGRAFHGHRDPPAPLVTAALVPQLACACRNPALESKVTLKVKSPLSHRPTLMSNASRRPVIMTAFQGASPIMTPQLDAQYPLLSTLVYTLACLEIAYRPSITGSGDGTDLVPAWTPGSPLIVQRLPSHMLPFLRQLVMNVVASAPAALWQHANGLEVHHLPATDPFAWLVIKTLFAVATFGDGEDRWPAYLSSAMSIAHQQEGPDRVLVFLRKAMLLRAAATASLFISPYIDFSTEHEQLSHVLGVQWPPKPWSGPSLPARAFLDYHWSYHLISLPPRLDVLLARRVDFICDQCGTAPRDVAQCLVCGARMCMQSFCCTDAIGRGECTQHMAQCSGDVGYFLDLNRAALLLLHEEKGYFVPLPYLDAHGEPDLGHRRGRPMTLHAGRYRELEKLWCSQDAGSLLARKMEGSHDTGGWETM